MELREALTQIAEIREQVARTETFRGYRALPVAFSGILALGAATLQSVWVVEPARDLPAYLTLWVGAAVLSILATGGTMVLHCLESPSPLTRTTTLLAVGQFFPCVAAGGVLALVLVQHVPACVWMLPGLWAVLFSMGIFASYRLLPRAIFWVGAFYLTAGFFNLAVFQDEAAFSPWVMGLTFGLGQLLAAAILYWTLERPLTPLQGGAARKGLHDEK